MNKQTITQNMLGLLSHPSAHLRKKIFSAVAICSVLTVVECGCLIYYDSIAIDPALSADYDAAVQDTSRMDSEMTAISQAGMDERHIPDLWHVIVSARPKDCSFLSVSLGEEEKGAPGFARVDAVSSNQSSFFRFTDTLRDSHAFHGVSVNQIQKLHDQNFGATIVAGDPRGDEGK